jgi:hypothetical protein
MRVLLVLVGTLCLSACASTSHSWADDRPPVGVQSAKPMCSSGPNGKTANCASAILENAALNGGK